MRGLSMKNYKACVALISCLLFMIFFISGCSSAKNEKLQAQGQTYNAELIYCKDLSQKIDQYYKQLGEYDTLSSNNAAKELWITFEMMEVRYTDSTFAVDFPCEEAKNYIDNSIKCAQSGKEAIDDLNQHYAQDRTSPSWTSSYWSLYITHITSAFGYFQDASDELNKIRKNLDAGNIYE